jgi:N-dimethylarginine dimethylaminohydrolase
MLRICIKPTTFEVLPFQKGQNPYIHPENTIRNTRATKQHDALETAFSNLTIVTLEPLHHLPDVVFVANGGLSLPRLPKPLVVLPWMKYPQRQLELPYLRAMFARLRIPTVDFPGSAAAPFEGQAELKWFDGGKKAIIGYGYRSTRATVPILQSLLTKIYTSHGISPPTFLAVPIVSSQFYHFDVAALEHNDTSIIVHKSAFSPTSIRKLKAFLGEGNVTVIDTKDHFCLNSVIDGDKLVTHTISPAIKKVLEKVTGKTVHQLDTSEYEKSGGSVRCMTLDIWPGTG